MTQEDGRTDGAMGDRAWRGYDLRAGAPWAAGAGAATAGLMAARWLLPDVPPPVGVFGFFGAAGAVWLAVLARVGYRAVTHTYRLTDRALLIDRGFLDRMTPPVWLSEVTGVAWGHGVVGRWLGVGWVRVGVPGGRRVPVLTGVRDPAAFAAAVREAVAAARAG